MRPEAPQASFQTPPCRLCGAHEPLCRSHIYPRFTFKRMKATDGHFMRFDGVKGAWENIRRQDDCVEYLLCKTCEQRFQRWESAIARIIARGLFDRLNPIPGKKYTVLQLPEYSTAKLYLLSLLWRSHAARDSSFRHVSLGDKHDARLRHMLLTDEPGEPWEYGCFISIPHLNLDDGKFNRPPMSMMPETMRFDTEHGLRLVRMVIDGIVLHFILGSPERMKNWRGSPMFPQRDGRVIVGVTDAMDMTFFREQLLTTMGAHNPLWD